MASSLNRVILIGCIDADPVLTIGPKSEISNFRLVTERVQNGSGRTVTESHPIVAFGKIAEQCNQSVRPGRLICLEGSLQTRSWNTPAGEMRHSTEVVAWRVSFLDGGDNKGGKPINH